MEDGIHTEGIVDAEDMEAFQGKLEALQEKWDNRERKCNPGKKPVFFNATRLMKWLPTCFDLCVKLQV